jgi:hypothetical protein
MEERVGITARSEVSSVPGLVIHGGEGLREFEHRPIPRVCLHTMLVEPSIYILSHVVAVVSFIDKHSYAFM